MPGRSHYTSKTKASALDRARRYGGQFGVADALVATDGLWIAVVWLRPDQSWMADRLAHYGVVGVKSKFAGQDEKERYTK